MTATAVPAADDARVPPVSARWALLLSTAVLWFLLEALWRIIASANVAVALITRGAPEGLAGVAGRLLPLVAMLTPALPLGGWMHREKLAVRGAGIAIAAGFAQAALPEGWRTAAAVVAFAGGAWFLVGVVGIANRRAVAAGLAGAFLARELVQHGGWPSAIPGRESLLLGAAVALAGLAALHRWRRAPGEDRGDSFERRAGGVRLRGALALGAILFFEVGFGLGVRAGMSPAGAAASTAVGAAAWLVLVRGLDVSRHRLLSVALSLVVAGCALAYLFGEPRDSALEVAGVIGQAAAFLLLDRALAPVSGRRSGGNLAIGFALVASLVLVRAAIWSGAPGHRPGVEAALLPIVVAGAVLVIAMYLTPRPSHAPSALPDRVAIGVALMLPVVAALLASG